MNSYKASIGNVMYVYQNKLTNLHLLFNCYRKEKMHRQLQKGILKATLNQYTSLIDQLAGGSRFFSEETAIRVEDACMEIEEIINCLGS